jgi:hypothetical protein
MRSFRAPRSLSAAALGVLGLLAASLTPAAAAPPPDCTAGLRIFTTSTGVERQAGPVLIFTDSGVGGSYTSGFLAGSTISGAQHIMLNTQTNLSELNGEFVATGPQGTLSIQYVGHADLSTGMATGQFVSAGGTGAFSDFHWQGRITARLVGPATFDAVDSGPCFTMH